jgi:thiol-disulfide isomerase/thioredoxin
MWNRPSYKSLLSFLSYLILGLAIAYIIMQNNGPSLPLSQEAPIDDVITNLDGKKFRFRALLNKPLLVNFWASWCPPCQRELPSILAMAKKYKAAINFVGVAVDSPLEDIVRLKKALQLDYLLVMAEQKTVGNWLAQTLPTTYIISKTGTVLWAKAGLVSESALDAALEKVLSSRY